MSKHQTIMQTCSIGRTTRYVPATAGGLLESHFTISPFEVDLTRYGIEPNPGPKVKKTSQIKAMMKQPKPKQSKSNPKRTVKAGGFLSSIGSKLGGYVGGPVGSLIGSAAGSFLGKITGLGAYKVQKNTLLTDNSPPVFGGGSYENGMIVTHREYLKDIFSGPTLSSGSTLFNIEQLSLNLGLPSTFPWLSNIAVNFEQYELLGLVFEFKTTSATAVSSTNTALGTVIMATDYDALDTPFTSKQQMEAYQFATSTVPCVSMIHPIECKSKLNVLGTQYIRSGPPPTGSDIRFYDMGTLYIATVGMQAAGVNLGELWVSYHVRLLKPKLLADKGSTIMSAHWKESPDNTAINSLPFGSDGPSERNNSCAASLKIGGSAGTYYADLTLPLPGIYLVAYMNQNSSSWFNTESTSTLFSPTNCSFAGNFRDNGFYYYTTKGTTGSLTPNSAAMNVFLIDVKASGNDSRNTVRIYAPVAANYSDVWKCDLVVSKMLYPFTVETKEEIIQKEVNDLYDRLRRLEIGRSNVNRACDETKEKEIELPLIPHTLERQRASYSVNAPSPALSISSSNSLLSQSSDFSDRLGGDRSRK